MMIKSQLHSPERKILKYAFLYNPDISGLYITYQKVLEHNFNNIISLGRFQRNYMHLATFIQYTKFRSTWYPLLKGGQSVFRFNA